jgi:8-amino-7-oxononanoate synthase
VAEAGAAGIAISLAQPERRERVIAAAAQLRQGMAALGIMARGFGPIVPWIVGDPAKAVALAQQLRAEGIDVGAIRPPSVPVGTARLRFTVTAAHSEVEVARALEIVARVVRRFEP